MKGQCLRQLRICKPGGNVFDSGYTYTITRTAMTPALRCDSPNVPFVAAFTCVVTIN